MGHSVKETRGGVPRIKMKREREEEEGGAAMSLPSAAASSSSARVLAGAAMEGPSGFYSLRAPSPIVRAMRTRLDPPLRAAPPAPLLPHDRLLPPPGFPFYPPARAPPRAHGQPGGLQPRILKIHVGEDVVSRIVQVSLTSGKAVCVLSVLGSVQEAKLFHPSRGILNYKGPLEIIRMFGSILTPDSPGSRCLSVTLACADCSVVGGIIAGPLIAATTVQAIVGTFYDDAFRMRRTPKIIAHYPNSEVAASYGVACYPNSHVPVANGISHLPSSQVTIGTESTHHPSSQVDIAAGSTYFADSQVAIDNGSTTYPSSHVTGCDGSVLHSNPQVVVDSASTNYPNSQVLVGTGSTHYPNSRVSIDDGSTHQPVSHAYIGDGSTPEKDCPVTVDNGGTCNPMSQVTAADGRTSNSNSVTTVRDGNAHKPHCRATVSAQSIRAIEIPVELEQVGNGGFHCTDNKATVCEGVTPSMGGSTSCIAVEQDGSTEMDVNASHVVA